MSEIETLTGEDATERVEMALGQPITSREQSPERMLQERKLQNNVIITPYDRAAVIPTEQVIITPCTYSPGRPVILNKLPEALVQDDWPAVTCLRHKFKKKSVLPRQLRTASKKKDYILSRDNSILCNFEHFL